MFSVSREMLVDQVYQELTEHQEITYVHTLAPRLPVRAFILLGIELNSYTPPTQGPPGEEGYRGIPVSKHCLVFVFVQLFLHVYIYTVCIHNYVYIHTYMLFVLLSMSCCSIGRLWCAWLPWTTCKYPSTSCFT